MCLFFVYVKARVRFRLTKVGVFTKISRAAATPRRFKPAFHGHSTRLLCRKSAEAELPSVPVARYASPGNQWKRKRTLQQFPNSTPQPQLALLLGTVERLLAVVSRWALVT